MIKLTNRITSASQTFAFALRQSVETQLAAFTVGSAAISRTVDTDTPVACAFEKFSVECAVFGETIAHTS